MLRKSSANSALNLALKWNPVQKKNLAVRQKRKGGGKRTNIQYGSTAHIKGVHDPFFSFSFPFYFYFSLCIIMKKEEEYTLSGRPLSMDSHNSIDHDCLDSQIATLNSLIISDQDSYLDT